MGDEDRRLAFGSDSEFVVLDRSIRDTADATSPSTRAFLIDARSGTVVRKISWPSMAAPYGTSRVFATSMSGFAIAYSGTTLYGPGLEEVLARSPHSAELASPQGGRLVAPFRPVKKEEWVLLDGVTLAELGMLPDFQRNRSAVSDHCVGGHKLNVRRPPYVEIEPTGQPQVELPVNAIPSFISDEALFLLEDHRFTVVSIAGVPLFSGTRDEDDQTHVSVSRSGKRIAVTGQRYSGHWDEVESEQVTVYDLDSRGPIWTVKHTLMKSAFSGGSGVALSPDGTLLAINSNGVITMYRLPDRAK